jgi:hypothetical protein
METVMTLECAAFFAFRNKLNEMMEVLPQEKDIDNGFCISVKE